jgi:hypothetical protein
MINNMSNNEFSTLPTGAKYKTSSFVGGVKQKLEKITRSGESKILHDKVDTISHVLDKYSTYIKRGGLSRLQRIAVARAIKNEGSLTKSEYRLVKELVKEYARGRIDDDLTSVILGKKKKLAKQSGIDNAKNKKNNEYEDEGSAFALGRKKQRILFAKQLVAPQTRVSAKDSGVVKVSAINNFDENQSPVFAKNMAGRRKEIRDEFKSGALKIGLTKMKSLGASALGFGGEKGSAQKIGIQKPKTNFAFSSKELKSSKINSYNGKKPVGF